ncbi:hypothetical protein CYQ55_11875 [Enterococcus faecium]|nr:hypothetical protein CYQ75_11775 [Enterococcus faecium]RXW80002.1 hypothetical protein CYQ64_11870 [Enterococcus faecium]RXW81987.1 hypothetical protein CYQ62_12710 [Enterococcus faecium]RXX02361.1 hypothetical protein CYQ55_11875 [Enterococcus faecium]
MHHLIGFMGGLQVNSLVFTSQKRKKRLSILPVFFPFFYLFFQFLNQCKKFCFAGSILSFYWSRFFHFQSNTSGRSIPFSRI